jgi:hypothetical protein
MGDDGVVHHVPVASQLIGDVVDGSAVSPDLFGDPPPGSMLASNDPPSRIDDVPG